MLVKISVIELDLAEGNGIAAVGIEIGGRPRHAQGIALGPLVSTLRW